VPKRNRGRNPYRQDARTRAAKARGYAARSVFKLEEIDRRVRLLKPTQHVLDLGAAPGSWTAYAAKRVGSKGRIIALDLKPLEQAVPAQVTALEADAYEESTFIEGPAAEAAPYHVVLSDMAPNTTGDKRTDQIRSFDIFMRAVALSDRLLVEGGSFVGKLFMSGDFQQARDALRERFVTVRTIRPEAVRDVSYEVFLVGLERKTATATNEPKS